jgi:hypothetical protein
MSLKATKASSPSPMRSALCGSRTKSRPRCGPTRPRDRRAAPRRGSPASPRARRAPAPAGRPPGAARRASCRRRRRSPRRRSCGRARRPRRRAPRSRPGARRRSSHQHLGAVPLRPPYDGGHHRGHVASRVQNQCEAIGSHGWEACQIGSRPIELISASSKRTEPVIHTLDVDSIAIRSCRDSPHVDLERVDNFRPLAEPASVRSAERGSGRVGITAEQRGRVGCRPRPTRPRSANPGHNTHE